MTCRDAIFCVSTGHLVSENRPASMKLLALLVGMALLAACMPRAVAELFATGLSRDLIGSGLVASNPYAIAAAPDGSALYVADGASGRVLRVALDGALQLFAELPRMPPLTGLAFGPDGRLYFADFSAPRQGAILKIACRALGAPEACPH
jgi:hypothetical protein